MARTVLEDRPGAPSCLSPALLHNIRNEVDVDVTMAGMGVKTNGIARMSHPSISRPANEAIDPTRVPNPFCVTFFFSEEGATYALALLPVWGG
ncbi:hypothetical protein BDN67DRAFT_1014112 [Paxillus ammoniavirescens]|nr:hypothetical protein BDN67DRAFT_1014112 [Paxillus ammoniavirescens]